MTDTYIQQIWLDSIEAEDITPLQLAADVLPFGYKVEDILGDIREGYRQLWRGVNKVGRFVLVTQIVQHPGGKELNVWTIAGQGYIYGLKQAHAKMIEFGKENNCKWLTGMVRRKGFERAYRLFPHRDVSRYLIGDIP